MLLTLESRAKTVPGNHKREGWDSPEFGEPGYSITPEALETARRRETEYTDWREYERIQTPSEEHPEYRGKGETSAIAKHWEGIIRELEPLPRGV